MLTSRCCLVVICLIGVALATSILSPMSVSAQEVQLIFGSGFKPATLKEGSRPAARTWIEADNETIVVLKHTWSIRNGSCEDWVILRGAQYRIPASSPSTCPKRGRGDEVARAMAGHLGMKRLTEAVLQMSNPKADDPLPRSLASLRNDLWELREKAEEEARRQRAEEKARRQRAEEEARRQRRTCVISGRVVHQDTGRPLAGVGMDLYRSLRNQRPKILMSKVATTGRAGDFAIDCSSIAASNFPLIFGLHRGDWSATRLTGPKVERQGIRDGLVLRVRTGPAPPAPGKLVRLSFGSRQEGSTWFVIGRVENVSGRHLACVRLRFKMSTSFQDKQRGVPDRDLGILEVEVRNLDEGEKRAYRKAMPGRVGFGQARPPARLCK